MRLGTVTLAGLCLFSAGLCQSQAELKKQAEAMKKEAAKQDKLVKDALKARSGGDWRKSTLTPLQLAQKASEATRNLKGAEAEFQTLLQTARGRGNMKGTLRVGDQNNYFIDFTVIGEEPRSGTLVASNGSRQVRRGEKVSPQFPVSRPLSSVATEDPAKLFFSEFSRLMYRGLTDRKDAWVPLVQGLATRYPLKVEERRVTYQGTKFVSYRLSGATLGKQRSNFEIIVDGKFWLPVTVRQERVDAKGMVWQTQWSARYRFGQKFPGTAYMLRAAR